MVDMVPEARKWHAEQVGKIEPPGEETDIMKMVRLMADDIEGWEKAFELYANANQLATKLYRAAHPDYEFKLPDQGKMIAWLCGELARINEINRHLVKDFNANQVRTARLEIELRQAKCVHDYEAEDDKGWTCKKCGHGT
jgi:hypothetical protein